MKWGVGAGRCGTKSLALLLNGTHEPFPGFEDLMPAWLQKPNKDLEAQIKHIIQARLTEGKPSVDFAQTYLMDLIAEVDPDPWFVWVLRNPITNIESMLRLEWWTDLDANGRYKPAPLGGWAEGTSRLEKAIWHWNFTNRTVMGHTYDESWFHPIEFYEAKELMINEHHDPRGIAWCLSPDDMELVVDRTAKTWSQIRLMLDQDGDAL